MKLLFAGLVLFFTAGASAEDFAQRVARVSAEPVLGARIKMYSELIVSWRPEDGDDNLGAVYNNLGMALMADHNHKDALIFFSKAVRLMPKNATVRNNRSNCLSNLRRSSEGLKENWLALELEPDNLNVLGSRCNLLIRIERYAEARQFCDAYVKRSPARTMLESLALIDANLGHHAEAARELAQAQQAGGPGAAEGSRSLESLSHDAYKAVVIAYAGDWEGGEALLTKCIADAEALLSRGETDALQVGGFYLWRGRLRLRRGQTDKAIADFDWIIAKDPQASEAFAARAEANAKAGRPALAAADRAKACKLGWEAACPKKKKKSDD